MARRSSAIALFFALAACRAELSVGAPHDAGADATDAAADAPFTCPPSQGREAVATIGPPLGQIRAIAAGDLGEIYAAARRDDGTGTLVRVAAGEVRSLGDVGRDPARVAAGGAYVYVTAPGSGQVARVAKDGSGTAVLPSEPGASAIVADGSGAAMWTVATPAVHGTTAATLASVVVPTTVMRPTALATDGARLFVAGNGMVGFVPSPLASPNALELAANCDGSAVAFDGTSVLCSDGFALLRAHFDRSAPDVAAAATGNIREIVVAGGRAFFRADGAGIMAMPIDGVGGPTQVPIPGDATSLTADRCFLYYVTGQTIERWPL